MSRWAGMYPASEMMRRSSSSLVRLRHAGGEDDVFLDQDAADVVGAELQAHLADLDPRRQPARLDVIDVVEVEAADGQRLQIIDGGGFRNFFPERRIFRREHPRNERGEPAGIFLNAAQALEVIDAVAVLLAAAEHHRGGGAHAERMRDAVHVFPFVGGALEARDARANFVVENFRAAAGNRVEPGGHQARDRFAHAQPGDFRDADDLRRRKTVQMDLREALLERAQQIFVILDAQVRMQAALQQNAGAAQLEHLFDLLVDRLEREQVAFLRAQRAVERAERAVFRAEIRVVDVAVDLVGGHARVGLLAAHFHRRHADADQVVGAKQIERFLWCQSHRGSALKAYAIATFQPCSGRISLLEAQQNRFRCR